ncbi:MAG: hypothetical protein ACREJO_16940, partial [Phycisphaerales bacterium]
MQISRLRLFTASAVAMLFSANLSALQDPGCKGWGGQHQVCPIERIDWTYAPEWSFALRTPDMRLVNVTASSLAATASSQSRQQRLCNTNECAPTILEEGVIDNDGTSSGSGALVTSGILVMANRGASATSAPQEIWGNTCTGSNSSISFEAHVPPTLNSTVVAGSGGALAKGCEYRATTRGGPDGCEAAVWSWGNARARSGGCLAVEVEPVPDSNPSEDFSLDLSVTSTLLFKKSYSYCFAEPCLGAQIDPPVQFRPSTSFVISVTQLDSMGAVCSTVSRRLTATIAESTPGVPTPALAGDVGSFSSTLLFVESYNLDDQFVVDGQCLTFGYTRGAKIVVRNTGTITLSRNCRRIEFCLAAEGALANGDIDGDGNPGTGPNYDDRGQPTCNDWLAFLAAYGKSVGQSGYVLAADLNSDGVIDYHDMAILRPMLVSAGLTRCLLNVNHTGAVNCSDRDAFLAAL